MTMTGHDHDTFTDLPAGTPALFTLTARGLAVQHILRAFAFLL
ncbi:hypothetical protein [Thioclava indica]|uniref:Uncharacterized protein n=1 Tax=Thioclava indica TaxID=1353528 RepID=A0A074JFK8_9RHOB|nr:hypothetical protein DT23_18235 [Thioclava indica]